MLAIDKLLQVISADAATCCIKFLGQFSFPFVQCDQRKRGTKPIARISLVVLKSVDKFLVELNTLGIICRKLQRIFCGLLKCFHMHHSLLVERTWRFLFFWLSRLRPASFKRGLLLS